eukprot:CAMPEP_0168494174 /NCGR_PEP_ID=MMETSP0228-20121227/71094_1 /TAXON_ID=133427 /ORGANISM="Protoceratium reticulatum, Strain CCCM 535 (=CCMP 1889)" /LENGTH=84 /DNA_ID=CAMNT_0008510971 /DNA_START=398 /DNA_END=649 /DNA_ORIENTATION=+
MNLFTSSGSLLQMSGRFMTTSCARLERLVMIWFSLPKASTFPVCCLEPTFSTRVETLGCCGAPSASGSSMGPSIALWMDAGRAW